MTISITPNMTPQLGVEWLAYAARRNPQKLAATLAEYRFTQEQMQLIGTLLENSPIINPRQRTKVAGKMVTTMCACGCGEFTYEQKTKRRKWKTEACRSRQYRREQREERSEKWRESARKTGGR